MMERRDFLATLTAPVALLPFYPSVETQPATTVAPPIVPAVEEPPLFFYVSTTGVREGDDRLLDEIATSPTEIAYHKKNWGKMNKKKYRRVRFVPLDREERFAVCGTEWSAGVPDFRVHEHGTPENEADWEAYWERQVDLSLPRSLLDLPDVLEDHEREWTQGCFPLGRAEAMAYAAELNEKSIAEGVVSDRGFLKHFEWHAVVELGRPVPRAFLEMHIDRNGFGKMVRERQWPFRLVRPTADEVARFPVTAEILAKGGVA